MFHIFYPSTKYSLLMGSLISSSSVVILSSSLTHSPSSPPNLVPFSCVTPILKNRIKPKFNFKSKCNKKMQLPELTITSRAVSSSSSSVTSSGDKNGCPRGFYNYGGWDDFGPSNSVSGKHGVASLWDWLENWENHREKSLIVMGFGLGFTWSVLFARPTTLWWICLPLSFCGLLIFLVFLRDAYTIQNYRSSIPSNSKGKSSIRGKSSLGKKVSIQVGVLCDLVLNILLLDKSAQIKFLRLMQNDMSFSEFVQTDRKSNRNPQSEEVNLYPQIWRHGFEEGDEQVASVGRNPEPEKTVSESPGVMAGEEMAEDINSAGNKKTSDLGKEDVSTNGSVVIAEMMDSSGSGIGRVHGISRESSFGCSSVPQLGQVLNESKKRKSQNHCGPVQDGENNIVGLLWSRGEEYKSDQNKKWARHSNKQSLDEYATDTHERHTKNRVYDSKQLSDNNGYVLEHLGGNKRLGAEGEQNTPDIRGIINQSASQVDEENGEKNLKGLDILQNYTRKKAQTPTNHVDVPPWKSTEAKQRVENPSILSAAEKQGFVKEQELFETCNSSLISPDQSNIFQTSLHMSESSGFEKPGIGIQGNRQENRVNSNDRNGKQETVAEKGYSMDSTNSGINCQAEFNQIKSNSEHSESSKSKNAFSNENFQICLVKGETLLKEAKNILRGKTDLGDAERMLCEAADLFSTASGINPTSLVAVGQLGNTLLVHGELKLKLSQELRSWLQVQDDSLLSEKVQKYQPDESSLAMMERENVAETLHEVCEECEKLLVEAGKKYRTALMLDRYDVRSLYNWGLALCFRAQLMAGGNKTALTDADKIYLAAIDKFEAMMRISQVYAPDALFSWGLAMRNRSRMRPMGSKERRRLLQQARQLFQDALKFNPNHAQAKRAFISCIHELKELEYVLLKNRRQGPIRSRNSWNVD